MRLSNKAPWLDILRNGTCLLDAAFAALSTLPGFRHRRRTNIESAPPPSLPLEARLGGILAALIEMAKKPLSQTRGERRNARTVFSDGDCLIHKDL